MLLTGGASYRGFFVEKRVLSWLSSFLGLMFPDGVYTSCIGPGSPRPCMSWRPGNPRHLSVDSIRASALLEPVSVPPHGWPEPTPAPRRCPRSHLQQDTGTVPCGAETPRGRSQLQHPAGRGSTPSPTHQTPLPNRPINECGTGACYGSLERGFLVYFPSFSPFLLRAYSRSLTPFQGFWRRLQPGVALPAFGAAVGYYLAYEAS
jgi:hypothetical protein